MQGSLLRLGDFELFGDSFLSLFLSEFSLNEFFMISLGVFGGGFGNSFGVLSDFSVNLGEQGFNSLNLSGSQGLFNSGELSLEIFRGVFLKFGHVVINMNSEDSFSVDSSIILVSRIGILGESGESLLVVGDIESTIRGSFHGSEDSLSDSGVDNSDIEEGFEGSLFLDVIVNSEQFSINSGLSFIHVVELSLFK